MGEAAEGQDLREELGRAQRDALWPRSVLALLVVKAGGELVITAGDLTEYQDRGLLVIETKPGAVRFTVARLH